MATVSAPVLPFVLPAIGERSKEISARSSSGKTMRRTAHERPLSIDGERHEGQNGGGGEVNAKIKIHMNDNGTTMAFDEHGKQIPKLQQPWMLLYLKFLQDTGVNLSDVRIRLPNDHWAEVLETPNGLNWNFF